MHSIQYPTGLIDQLLIHQINRLSFRQERKSILSKN